MIDTMVYLVLFFLIIFCLLLMWIYFFLFWKKLLAKETEIIALFQSRNSIFPGLFEITKDYLNKNDEIFAEVFELLKREFSMLENSKSIEAFFELESKIHHELNFIFQVCNITQKLQREKRFLYLRDVVIEKSSQLGKSIQVYNRYITIYNKMLKYKNYSIVWLLLPFHQKTLLV